jgi:RNA polymerase primary sigma factor
VTVAPKKASPKAASKTESKSKKAATPSKTTLKSSKAKAPPKPLAKNVSKSVKPKAKLATKPAAKKPASKSKAISTGPVPKAKKSEPKTKLGKSKISDLPEDELEEDDDVLESVEDIVADVAEAVDITAVEIDPAIEEVEEVVVPGGGFVLKNTEEDDIPAQTTTITGATADPVKDYLKQIGKVALLNAELEVELAKRIEAGLFAEEKLAGKRQLSKDLERDLRWVV